MSKPDLPTVAVLLTCFNRKQTTLAALSALDAACAGSCDYQIVLVDDGSSDGTGDAVRQAFPQAHVISSSGNLFWNGGMRLAWQSALPLQPDFYLWLNDDTALRPGAVSDLLALYRTALSPKTIAVGCTVDPRTGVVTYGGYKRAGGLSRLRFRRLTSDETHCDSMNGNCVLFPASAVSDVGINSGHYRHAFGDNDYGLRARNAGYDILELKVPVAEQEKNEKYIASVSRLTLRNWRFILTHPKGIPVREWCRFCLDHGGPLGLVNFFTRYLKMLRV